jgi:antitoxin FitA
MTQLLVRNFSESLKTRLRRRAERHGHSMEKEARDILSAELAKEAEKPEGLGTRIANRFKRHGFKKGEIKELRGQLAFPARFDN